MSSTLYSGSAITTLPVDSNPNLARPSSSSSSNRSGQGRRSAWEDSSGVGSAGGRGPSGAGDRFLDAATVVYAAAGLGVVHDLSTNRQKHYNGHLDDVTCLAVSTDGTLAATGRYCNIVLFNVIFSLALSLIENIMNLR